MLLGVTISLSTGYTSNGEETKMFVLKTVLRYLL